ncbi:MAG: FliH/SctL family protein [Terracidiphilus sp.]|jgi:flagellar assembly protein FliH
MASANGSNAPGRFEIFEYPAGPDAPALPAWSEWTGPGWPEPGEHGRDTAVGVGASPEFERQLSEETRRSFEAGRERGLPEGRQAEREAQVAAQSAAEARRMRQAAELMENLAQERDNFLHAVEHEVVELALAVAARILRREAQMDPLLLTGAVRVALGQLSASTQVRLRVPPAELELWIETIALLPNLAVKPVVMAGEGMLLGDCAIETELGSVDLGIRAQLGEIERGFFDRASARRAEPALAVDEAEGELREVRS